MKIRFETLNDNHKTDVMRLFNYYVENGTAAFAESKVPENFYGAIIAGIEKYPGYAVIEDSTDKVIGFCMLKPYHPLHTFYQTLDLTFFLDAEYTGKGVGSQCLEKLEADAKALGAKHLISLISSENDGSKRFHERHGFRFCGQLDNVGFKLNREFGVVYMQKDL